MQSSRETAAGTAACCRHWRALLIISTVVNGPLLPYPVMSPIAFMNGIAGGQLRCIG